MLGLRRTQRNERGDTLIEVMLVLAVLGMAIGIGYSIANRSLLGTRAAEQNAQATAQLRAQIEALRPLVNSVVTDPTHYIYSTTTYYCLNLATSPATIANITGSDLTDFTKYPGTCVADSKYYLAIRYDGASTFTFSARWDDIGGKGQDSVTLLYRMPRT